MTWISFRLSIKTQNDRLAVWSNWYNNFRLIIYRLRCKLTNLKTQVNNSKNFIKLNRDKEKQTIKSYSHELKKWRISWENMKKNISTCRIRFTNKKYRMIIQAKNKDISRGQFKNLQYNKITKMKASKIRHSKRSLMRNLKELMN